MATQDGWKACLLCSGLYFDTHITKGKCPAHGLEHRSPIGESQVIDFAEGTTPPNAQESWCWCWRCEGMFFAGHGTMGACPAGNEHDPNFSGYYRFFYGPVIPTAGNPFPGQWRWCINCEGMFLQRSSGLWTFDGACPRSSGSHDATHSALYAVRSL